MVNTKKLRNKRRGKFEICFDILTAIEDERADNIPIKPTRVQHRSNISYDRMLPYLDELKKQNMIARSLSITEKGFQFLKEYNKLKDLEAKIEKSYFSV